MFRANIYYFHLIYLSFSNKCLELITEKKVTYDLSACTFYSFERKRVGYAVWKSYNLPQQSHVGKDNLRSVSEENCQISHKQKTYLRSSDKVACISKQTLSSISCQVSDVTRKNKVTDKSKPTYCQNNNYLYVQFNG